MNNSSGGIFVTETQLYPEKLFPVPVPAFRYEELVKAEAELNVLRQAYENLKYDHDLRAVAAFVFGPKEEKTESGGDDHA